MPFVGAREVVGNSISERIGYRKETKSHDEKIAVAVVLDSGNQIKEVAVRMEDDLSIGDEACF